MMDMENNIWSYLHLKQFFDGFRSFSFKRNAYYLNIQVQKNALKCVTSLPHCKLNCRNPPMQEEDAKKPHQCQSLYDIQNILPYVSAVHGRSEITKLQKLFNKCFSFNTQILLLVTSLPLMQYDWSDLRSSQSTQQRPVVHILWGWQGAQICLCFFNDISFWKSFVRQKKTPFENSKYNLGIPSLIWN